MSHQTAMAPLVLLTPRESYDPTLAAQNNRTIEDADSRNARRAELRLRTFNTYKASTHIGLKQDVVLGDAVDGAITFTLPPVSDDHFQFDIKKIDSTANTVTIRGSGTETIDGSNEVVISSQWDSLRVASNGKAWYIL